MSILYINIDGENIQSTENVTVVGKPQNAIINWFYAELVEGIVKGVKHPRINDVKKKSLVTDFEANNKEAFAKITEQWSVVKQILLGENPTGTRAIALPNEYIEWLKYHSNPNYNEIAKSLAGKSNIVEISIERIYKNSITKLVNNIDLSKQYDQFVINDDAVKEISRVSIDIFEKIGKNVLYVTLSDWGDINNPERCPICGKNPCECVSINTYIYDEIDDFHEGLARVKRDGYYGFIDTGINEVISCEYDYADCFFEKGFCSVEIEKRDGTYNRGVIDYTGRRLFWGSYEDIEYEADIDGFSCSKNERCGVLDKHGAAMVPFVWDRLFNFHGGIAVAQKDDRWYIIDKEGNVRSKFPNKYNDVNWDDGVIIPVKKGENWGCVDMNFNEVVDFKYDNITSIGKGLFEVEHNGLHGIINNQGLEVVACQYDRIWSMRDGSFVSLLRKDGSLRFFNTLNRSFISGVYKDFYFQDSESDGEVYFGLVNDNDQGVLVDEKGKIVLSTEYRRIGVPHEGLIIAKYYDEDSAEWYKDDDDDFDENNYMTWGLIDIEGNEVVPFIYESVSKPYHGLIVVQFRGEYCIINTKNELVFANKVDREEWKQANDNGYK